MRKQVKLSREDYGVLQEFLANAHPYILFKYPYYVSFKDKVYLLIGRDRKKIYCFPLILYSKELKHVIYAGRFKIKRLNQTEVLLHLL